MKTIKTSRKPWEHRLRNSRNDLNECLVELDNLRNTLTEIIRIEHCECEDGYKCLMCIVRGIARRGLQC